MRHFCFSAIVMTHCKLKTEEVAQCLISGNSNLTSDVLRQLLAFAPDDQEVTMATSICVLRNKVFTKTH